MTSPLPDALPMATETEEIEGMTIDEAVAQIRVDIADASRNGVVPSGVLTSRHALEVLLSAYEAREADSKRLDMLDRRVIGVSYVASEADSSDSEYGWYCSDQEGIPLPSNGDFFKTPREAIDAALSGRETP